MEFMCRILELRDEADNKQIYNEFLFDFYHRNLKDYLLDPKKYEKKLIPTHTETNHQDFIVKHMSYYMTCGICVEEDVELGKNGLCDRCHGKLHPYLTIYHNATE